MTNQNETFITPEEKTWGMLVHLAAFSSFIFFFVGAIIGPLAIWLIKKDQMPFVNDQGKEALNFNISIALYAFISSILIYIGIGLILVFFIYAFWFILTIMAAIQAYKGKYFRYPLTIRLIK